MPALQAPGKKYCKNDVSWIAKERLRKMICLQGSSLLPIFASNGNLMLQRCRKPLSSTKPDY
jgi:hypothetical protein